MPSLSTTTYILAQNQLNLCSGPMVWWLVHHSSAMVRAQAGPSTTEQFGSHQLIRARSERNKDGWWELGWEVLFLLLVLQKSIVAEV